MRSLLFSSSALALSLAFSPMALAQDLPEAEDAASLDENEIVVTAGIIAGAVNAPQQPILSFGEEEIASYGASSLTDLLAAVATQTGTGRGRGGRPVILFNGQRISNFREFRNIPPEAIKRMEVLPEEVALRFGYPPNQRVINFILRENFAARSFDLEYETPSRGGFARTEFEASLLKIGKNDRFNLNIQAEDESLLTEAERNVRQQPGSQPVVPGDPDPARARSLNPDSRNLAITTSWSKGLGEEGRSGSFSMNGSIARTDSRSLAGLSSVTLVPPTGPAVYRTLGDPLERNARTLTVSGGAALNTAISGWQLSLTSDASTASTETRTDQRIDTSALVAAAAAGTLSPSGPLQGLAPPGLDVAKSRTTSINSLATLSGTPFRLPAGEVSLTVKGGYEHSGIRSRDSRIAGRTKLTREDRYGGLNLSLPITSRSDMVLEAVGDLSLNLSAGVADLSDFGSLSDWSAGLTWAPTEKLSLQASYIVDEAAPGLGELGNPLVQSFNVPVYDFARGETALVTITNGGNPGLRKEKQRDIKLSANWQLPILANSSLLVEWFRNRSDDVTASFPLLTPEIEAAFPGRAVRDASGRLVSIDRRPITFDTTKGERLRWGINLSGTIGKAPPAPAGRGPGAGAGGPPVRMGGPGGGGFRGPPMMFGGGNGQGRWNLSVYHTWRFAETVRVAPGGPVLDLLGGDAISGGGVARHSLEFEGGAYHRGFGLRLNGTWSAPTRLDASGAPGTSDLRFGSAFVVNLRTWVDFDRHPGSVKAVPFLKGARLAFVVDNVLDSRSKVTDEAGVVPINYQKDVLDPRGRFFGVDFRKVF